MDNDSLHILRTLYQERKIDTYRLHATTKIPPTTLYTVLESNKRAGWVTRNGLVYQLTSAGEQYIAATLEQELIKPSVSFKSIPEKYIGSITAKDDVTILNEIL